MLSDTVRTQITRDTITCASNSEPKRPTFVARSTVHHLVHLQPCRRCATPAQPRRRPRLWATAPTRRAPARRGPTRLKIVTSVPHTLTSVKIECFERLGEAWMLLGGDRLEDQFLPANPNVLAPALLGHNSLISSVTANEIIFQGRYPMQRSTSPQIYLRCDVPNDNNFSDRKSTRLNSSH